MSALECNTLDSQRRNLTFMSQKLGRGTASVTDLDSTRTLVMLAFHGASVASYQFEVDRKAFQAYYPNAAEIDELIVRVAITRIHRDASHVAGIKTGERLSPLLAPWVGDFTHPDAARARMPSSTRRVNDNLRVDDGQMETLVERALHVHRTQGRLAAVALMRAAKVPPSVIRRVLSHSIYRRKSGVTVSVVEDALAENGTMAASAA